MDNLFITILNMSLTGAFVIAGICIARLPLRKAPKIISYCLWAVAGFRLLFPFSIESALSLMPFNPQPIPPDIAMQAVPRINSGISALNHAVSGVLPAAAPYASINPLQLWMAVGAAVWLFGAAVMLAYGLVSYILLKQKMRTAAYIEGNIYEAENIQSPFLLGIFAPKIYLPIGLSGQERGYVVLHEQTHIKRRDHLIKFLAYFILCLHWFNPLAWLAFLLMGADMEMSCDERVLKEIGGDTKKNYSLSLLSLATERRMVAGSPLAFGEGGVKARIKNILNFRKPSRIITVASIALAVILSAGFTMNRAMDEADYPIPEIILTETKDGAQAKALRFGYSWYDGKNGVTADSIAAWQGTYGDENTLIIDGENGQNEITLSAEKPISAGYVIYLPDGTVYDDGTREVYDSLGPRLFWTEDKTGILVHAPFELGEYIYEVTLGWEKDNLEVVYGFKLIMTGERNAYDEAMETVFDRYTDPLTAVSLKGTELLPGAAYAGECYVFDVTLPEGTERVAVSKEEGIFFTYDEGVWRAFTGLREQGGETRSMTLDDVRAIAQKIGPDLTMDDLSGFTGTEGGSGLYIVSYEIAGSDYVLLVGSGNIPDVWYAYLLPSPDAEIEDAIDIRYYDVDQFIADGTKELVRPLPEGTEPQPTASPSPEEVFLNSADGEAFQSVSYQAAEAMLRADAETLADYMADPSEAAREVRGLTDVFDDVAEITLSWNADSIQSETEVNASYQYFLEGEDSYSYVSMALVKAANGWKVDWIGLEK